MAKGAHQLSHGFEVSRKTPKTQPDILAPLGSAMLRLETLLQQHCDSFEPSVAACIRYVTSNQGKRLRPALTIFSANAHKGDSAGTVEDEILKICAVVEMIHIATLVHDDIMDGAELRRNRLTAGAKWGHEISVLLGDSLFAQALVLASSYSSPFICRRVAQATAVVCSGEILQTQRRFDLKLSVADYLKMIDMKTGSLFSLACELGAHLAGAPDPTSQKFSEFGRLLGIAYQIYDDCIDLVGNEAAIGKSLGTDLQKGKLTLPVILLLQKARESEIHLISSILLNEHGSSRVMLLDFIKRYETLSEASQKGRSLLNQATELLQFAAPNEGRSCLENIVAYLNSEFAKLEET